MSTTIIQILQPYYTPNGLINPSEIIGVDSATATALIANGTAVEYTTSAGAGVPVANPQRGLGEGELASAYTEAGFTVGAQVESAAIQGYDGSVTITDGRAIPNRLVSPLDKLQA
jgi:hypothetical protein